MKKVFLSVALFTCTTLVFAQKYGHSYFGIKAGVNSSTNSYSPELFGISTSSKTGFAGGIYYNIGLGRLFSIQPELLYSVMGSKITQNVTNPTSGGVLHLNYVSIPVLFKVTPIWRLV
jgi:hypothetical protein